MASFGNVLRNLGSVLNPQVAQGLEAELLQKNRLEQEKAMFKMRDAATQGRFEQTQGLKIKELAENRRFRSEELIQKHKDRIEAATLRGVDRKEIAQMQIDARADIAKDANETRGMIARLVASTKEGGGDKPFGSGATGGALTLITNLAPKIQAGTATPDEIRRFQTAATHLQRPQTDPTTGLVSQGKLPQYAADALSGISGGQPVATPKPATPTATPKPVGGSTIFELSDKVSGPINAALSGASRIPGVGDAMNIAPDVVQAKEYVAGRQRNLVKITQNNPKYAEGERKAIEKEVNIAGQFIDSGPAYKNRLIGVGRSLKQRLSNAEATAVDPNVGKEERIAARNIANGVRQFLKELGVPQDVSSEEQYNALKPGTQYVDTRTGETKIKGGKK